MNQSSHNANNGSLLQFRQSKATGDNDDKAQSRIKYKDGKNAAKEKIGKQQVTYTNYFVKIFNKIADKSLQGIKNMRSYFSEQIRLKVSNDKISQDNEEQQLTVAVNQPNQSQKNKPKPINKKVDKILKDKDPIFDKNKPTQRALQLAYRMAKQRKNIQLQYIEKKKLNRKDINPKQTKQAEPVNNSINKMNNFAGKIRNISNSLDISKNHSRNAENQVQNSGSFQSQSPLFASSYRNRSKRAQNVGKIVRRYISLQRDSYKQSNTQVMNKYQTLNQNSWKINQQFNDNYKFQSYEESQSPKIINIYRNRIARPQNFQLLPLQKNQRVFQEKLDQFYTINASVPNKNPLIYRKSLIKQQKLRQLKILEQSKLRNQKYHLKKFIISLIFQIAFQAVDRIEQKRTFFSYRFHRLNPLKSACASPSSSPSPTISQIKISQSLLPDMVYKLAETIHPKHERYIQNKDNIKSFGLRKMGKSRALLDVVNQNGEKCEDQDGSRSRSRIESAFSFSLNPRKSNNQEKSQSSQSDVQNDVENESQSQKSKSRNQSSDNSDSEQNSFHNSQQNKSRNKNISRQSQKSDSKSQQNSKQSHSSSSSSSSLQKIQNKDVPKIKISEPKINQTNLRSSNNQKINTLSAEVKSALKKGKK